MSCRASSLSSMSLIDCNSTHPQQSVRCCDGQTPAREGVAGGWLSGRHLGNCSALELGSNGPQSQLHVPLGPAPHAPGTHATSWVSSSPSPPSHPVPHPCDRRMPRLQVLSAQWLCHVLRE